jgi:hypothetical protein
MDDYLIPINTLYKENLEKFGINSKSVGWKDLDSQNLRFIKLNQVLNKSHTSISINDYGSGYGAHLTNLLAEGWDISKYTAYDINLEMLEKLKENHKDLTTVEINCIQSPEIITLADYSLVSGTFNVMPNNNRKQWEENIQIRLMQLKEFSKFGFAFNLLSKYVDWEQDGLYYADPLFWFDFCKQKITRNISLLHDYDLYEWTIVCKFDD